MTAGTTEQIQKIITKGGIPAFEKLLKHENPDISEQVNLFPIGPPLDILGYTWNW